MRTAKEMVKFIDEKGLGKGMNKKWRLKHFTLAADQLTDGEEAKAVFIGLHNYVSTTKHDSYYAYVITDHRFIMAQKKMIGENVKIVNRKNLNDVTKSTGMMWGKLTFDTFKEKFNVAVDKDTINNVYSMINAVLFENPENNTISNQEVRAKSPVEELKEYKELLDMDIITQEDFDKKKAELLG
jgi:hypothetical protein